MAYEDYEESVEAGQPVELYLLVLGADTWRMHNSLEAEITYDGNIYYPEVIRRGAFTSGLEALTVNLPGDHAFSRRFTNAAPGQLATLTIFRYQRGDDTDVKVRYKGVVQSVGFDTDCFQSVLHLIPITAIFDKAIPDRTYQASCNNVLFDSKCQLTSASHKFTGTPTLAASNELTVPGLTASKGDGWATGGYVSFGNLDYRMILEQNADVLTLNLAFYETVVGQSVDVFAGCDHTLSTCNSKFSNAINFGGCPYVPTKNIFLTGL